MQYVSDWIVMSTNIYEDDSDIVGFFKDTHIAIVLKQLDGTDEDIYYSVYDSKLIEFTPSFSKVKKFDIKFANSNENSLSEKSIKELESFGIKVKYPHGNMINVEIKDLAETARSKLSKQEYDAIKKQIICGQS